MCHLLCLFSCSLSQQLTHSFYCFRKIKKRMIYFINKEMCYMVLNNIDCFSVSDQLFIYQRCCSYKVKTLGLQITHRPWSLCSRADNLEGSTLRAGKAVHTPVVGATSGQQVPFSELQNPEQASVTCAQNTSPVISEVN